MVKDGIKTELLRGKGVVLNSLNPYAIVIDENSREDGT
jgi:hypothetical protein